MAEQGFTRDITTPIAVPQVQAPDFSQNRSTVEDIADVASFGLAVFDRVQAGNREEKRQERVSSANRLADDLVIEYTNILEQKGGSKTKANIALQRKISNNPDSEYVNGLVAKRLMGLRADFPNAVAANKPPATPFDMASPEEKSKAMTELNLLAEPAVGTEERTKLDTLVNNNTANRVNLANSATAVANSAKESDAELDTLEIDNRKMLTNETRGSIVKATELLEQLDSLPIGQQAEGYKEIRRSMAILKGSMIDHTDAIYAGVTTSQGKERHEATLAQVNRVFKNFEDADDAVLQDVAKQTDWLVNAKTLDLLSAGEIIPLVEAITGGKIMNEVFWSEIIRSKKSTETIVQTVSKLYKLSEGQQAAFDVETFAKYVAGGGVIDDISDIPLTDEGRASLFKSGFSFYKNITKNGKLGEMDDLDKGKASTAIINILNDSNSKDPNTAEQIMSWIKDPEMADFLSKINPEQAGDIKNMMITTSKDSARNSGGNLKSINDKSDKIIFNTKTGEFTATQAGTVSSREDPNQARRLRNTISKANADVKVFLQNKDAHPTLKDMSQSEALHWFLKGGSGAVPLSDDVKVVGNLSAPQVEKQAQIEAEQTNQEWEATEAKIKFEASLPAQIAALKKEAKEARDKVGTSTDDMDDEEFAEYQKQELEARKK